MTEQKEAKTVGDEFRRFDGAEHPYEIGKAYLFKTVTMYYVGKIVAITKEAFIIEGASWVGDVGLQSKAFNEGSFNESDFYPNGVTFVHRGGMIEGTMWPHPLPKPKR